jgi:hypothetical protein
LLIVGSRPIRVTEARFTNGNILTYSGQSILGDHLEPSTPPKISLARGPPLWDAGDAAQIEVFDAGPDWAIERQISPADVQFDQSVNW